MKDYFVYFPAPAAPTPWGLTVVSAGFTRVQPGSPYPPYRHPIDHHFSWDKGRRLNSWTLVFISEGRGLLEFSGPARKTAVEAGTVFILFPGVWHRYAPDPATGWGEHWLECRGPVLDALIRKGLFTPRRSVFCTGVAPELVQAFDHCHAWARNPSPAVPPMLATLAFHLLATLRLLAAKSAPQAGQPTATIVHRAQLRMMQQCHESLRVEQLAAELGVSYSCFRQAFRRIVGVSPKQYHLQIRLQKTEDFLLNTPKSVKEIAEILGFDSPYHLSGQFKQHTGSSPTAWRTQHFRHTR